jgi:hypothetical protein
VQCLKLVTLYIWEVEIERSTVQGKPWQKVHKTPSQPMTGKVGTWLSTQLYGETTRKMNIQFHLGKK